jgi:5'-deoxynucleotidase YfbR-like HD superfamily hydrolase
MMNLEKFALDIQNVYKLKTTYRYTNMLFDGEKDSTAAHSWSMMILADFFLNYLEEVSP